VAEPVHVTAARIPDRDRLLQSLVDHGLPATPVGEVEIEVPLEDGGRPEGDRVFAEVESVVMVLGAPFVPIKHEDVIYVRPPIA
jgi:hypothetical protein